MTTVLLVDSSKSSIVMTSEIFKDKIPGATILIAENGETSFKLLSEHPVEMIVVDFDLPDTDGVTLSKLLHQEFEGPILITAFPEKLVEQAIAQELFAYHDSCAWIKKPVKFDDLSAAIDRFLVEKFRIKKRFALKMDAMVTGNGTGRGKKTPKAKGNIINMGMGGALIKMEDALKVKAGDEIMLSFHVPAKTPTLPKKAQSPLNKGSSKIKAKIAWLNKNKKEAGLLFEQLTDTHRKILEGVLRNAKEIPPKS